MSEAMLSYVQKLKLSTVLFLANAVPLYQAFVSTGPRRLDLGSPSEMKFIGPISI